MTTLLAIETTARLASFQLRRVAHGIEIKAGMLNKQPVRCTGTIPNVLIASGTRTSWDPIRKKPVASNTCNKTGSIKHTGRLS